MTDGSSAVALRFEILGPVRAFRGAEPVDLGPARQRAVLALLLLHAGQPVPVQRIVAALWNGDPPENAVDVVQRYVGALRRALDPERTSLLALTGDGYVLRAGENAVDAGQFRAGLARARTEHQTGDLDAATGQVREALALWQDEPLAGLTGPVFESARARLNEERTSASELLAAPPTPEPVAATPAYPEAVDPWAGHELFPPDPASMA
ncbi:AfsR/SARP family transcriptional regulator [Actinoplanes aureus]|uniref:Winged helix-turn-helix domain-containing protein n=1 Tax=Actinoplanes aureus TaxID=2792083 RepID=A0A931C4R6_9ACTN|nr:BTAD domain-containing putative transcriptional regulator [Actinoplanes aureus]MBG0561362.1 winged helix-turn-helix domain-containing protein [Actinoplanes aureus]